MAQRQQAKIVLGNRRAVKYTPQTSYLLTVCPERCQQKGTVMHVQKRWVQPPLDREGESKPSAPRTASAYPCWQWRNNQYDSKFASFLLLLMRDHEGSYVPAGLPAEHLQRDDYTTASRQPTLPPRSLLNQQTAKAELSVLLQSFKWSAHTPNAPPQVGKPQVAPLQWCSLSAGVHLLGRWNISVMGFSLDQYL